MKRVDVVIITMSNYTEWQRGVSNRNYHVLQELMRSEAIGKIICIDYPALTLKRSLRSFWDNIITPIPNARVIRHTPVDSIRKISDSLFVCTVYDFFLRRERFAEHVKNYIRAFGVSDFIVWSFVPYVMSQMQGLGQKLTIFDAVDNWTEHASYASYSDLLRDAYQSIERTADIIFTVSPELQGLFHHQSHVYWIPNGVDMSHYREKRLVVSRDIADIPRPIVGYIGVVQERVDLDLLMYLAQKNPSKSFVIIGPVWNEKDAARLARISNIYLLGYKSYEEAPAYIQQFDVGIIPHKPSTFVASTNPMKLYEYLACGIPVVATAGSGAEQFADHVHIAETHEDFNRKLFIALEEDSPVAREARIQAVAAYSWTAIVRRMLDVVEKKLPL